MRAENLFNWFMVKLEVYANFKNGNDSIANARFTKNTAGLSCGFVMLLGYRESRVFVYLAEKPERSAAQRYDSVCGITMQK